MYKKFFMVLIFTLCFLTTIVGCKDESKTSNSDDTKYGELLPDDKIITQQLIGQEFTFDMEESISGTIKYQFRNIAVYDNIYDMVGTELKSDIANPAFYGIDKNAVTDQHIMYPDYFDYNTGKIMDGYYFFVFEVKITNIDAKNALYDNPYLFNFSGLFRVVNRSGKKPVYARHAYFKEVGSSQTNKEVTWRSQIEPGETKTIYFGYMFDVLDTSDKPYSKMGLTSIYGGNTSKGSTYSDNNIFYWFDLSEIINDLQDTE